MARVLVWPVKAIVCYGLLLINASDLYFFSMKHKGLLFWLGPHGMFDMPVRISELHWF